MPALVLFGKERFQEFERKMLKRGFKRIARKKRRPDIVAREEGVKESDIPPETHDQREVGFIFRTKGLTVIVWTSYIESMEQARDSDNGWVLIKRGNEVLYFSHPMNRTENFLYRLRLCAAIAQVRIQNRPQCPECGRFMQIVRGGGIGSRFWRCFRHAKRVNLGWDDCMPEEAMPFVRKFRNERKAYNKRVKKKGGQPSAARLARAERNRARR